MAILPSIETHSTNEQAEPKGNSSLEAYQPIQEFAEGDIPPPGPIKKPGPQMAFCRTGNSRELGCVIDKEVGENGDFDREVIYPVNGMVQNLVKKPIRTICFHGCMSQTGEQFILIQKLPQSGSYNSWNDSKAEIVANAPGVWLRMRSDRENQRYNYEIVDLPPPEPLDWPEFETVLFEALSDNLIDSPDHPILSPPKEHKDQDVIEWGDLFND